MFDEQFHSLILAQVLGLYLVIMAIILLARTNHYRDLINNMRPDSNAIAVGASFSLIFGLLLIVIHNHWLWDSQIVITLVGWFIAIKSVLWLALPERMISLSRWMYSGPGYYIAIVIMAIVGIFLMTRGFYRYL